MSSVFSSAGGGSSSDSTLDKLVGLANSPSARNAAFALLAAAGIALSLRQAGKNERRSSRSDRPPRVPDKDFASGSNSNGSSRDEPYTREQLSRRHMRRSSSSSMALGMSNSTSSSSSSKSAVAIFWDVDNCSPPTGSSGHAVAQAIRKAAQAAGTSGETSGRMGSIVSFKAYLELSAENNTPNAAQVQLRSELQGSGVSLIDTPKSGRKDVADKMMIADLLSFAIDKRPPALIVLLSGDRDFAYPLGLLRNRGYEILLITPPIGATPILEASATHVLKWRQDVLGLERDAYGRLYDKDARRLEETGRGSPAKPARNDENDSAAAAQRQTPLKSFGRSTNFIPSSLRKSTPAPTPPVFVPLVQVLEQLQREGQNHPKRSIVALRLIALDPKVYEKAGANAWGEYVAVAESAGIVSLGNGLQSGMEWIALRGAPGPSPPGPRKGATGGEAPANASGNPAGYDVSLFHPLIEVWKQAKAGLPGSENPMAYKISSQLNYMIERRYADAYTQAGVRNFDEYLRLAEQAKVARLVPVDGKGRGSAVVEVHPRYATLHTGMLLPYNPSARMIDTSNVAAPEQKQSKLASIFSGSGNKNDSKATPASKEAPFPLGPPCPHQPSGEIVHAAFFPLANCLLTRRGEGERATPAHVVKAVISKHHKTGKFVSTGHDFEVYLARAQQDDVIRVAQEGEERIIYLSPRLCKGEGEDKHKGFSRGVNSNGTPSKQNGSNTDNSSGELDAADIETARKAAPMIRGASSNKARSTDGFKREAEATESQLPAKSDTAERAQSSSLPGPVQASPRFNTATATAQDRARFKPLIDALVAKRRQAQSEYDKVKGKGGQQEQDRFEDLVAAIEPLRGTVTTTLLATGAAPGSPKLGQNTDVNSTSPSGPIAPGAWLQRYGFASFGELYTEAEHKGFVHLVRSSTSTGQSTTGSIDEAQNQSSTVKDRVRLAERYENMFFPRDD